MNFLYTAADVITSKSIAHFSRIHLGMRQLKLIRIFLDLFALSKFRGEMSGPFFLFFFILILLIPQREFHAETINVRNIREKFPVMRYAYILEDPSGELTIDEILYSDEIQSYFSHSTSDAPGYGFSESAFWIEFSIENSSDSETVRYIEYDFAPTDRIDFFIIGKNNTYLQKTGGDFFPFRIRDFDFSNTIFSFRIKPGVNTYYMRVKTTSAVNLSLQLFDDDNLISYTGARQIWLGIFYGILLIMIFYNFFIYIVIRDPIYLIYSAYIIIGAAFQFSLNGLAFQYIWPGSVWLANNSVTLLLGLNLFFAGFFSKTFLKLKYYSQKLNLLMTACIILSIFGFITAFFSYSAAIRFETVIVPVLLITIFISGVVSYRNGLKEARYFLFAWTLFLIGGSLKALHSNGIVHDNLITSSSYQIGLAWEVALLSLALADRLRVVRGQMVDTLNEAFHIQKEQSEELEREVKNKTDEFFRQNEFLKKRKKAVDEELFIALNMQQKLIPQKNPVSYIASFYKPVIGVGGDLFDFIIFENSKKLGIFICDVVGHGVSAALTTSVIKTLILQAGEKKENPDKFLEYMNEMIVTEFNFGFITMYYGIFNPDTRELVSCSAGHLPPILIHENKIEKIEIKKICPIGICSNEELFALNKKFTLNISSLPSGSRVLFYTDGLGECQSPENGASFEDAQMEKVLIENSRESCHMIVHNLYESVQSFSKSSQFEDDICIVCLEVS